jgi:hypothetical protein
MQTAATRKVPSCTKPSPDMGLANPPQNPSQREAEVDCISGTITALPTLRTTGAPLDAGFDLYETGLLARMQVETRRIKEVSQWVWK